MREERTLKVEATCEQKLESRKLQACLDVGTGQGAAGTQTGGIPQAGHPRPGGDPARAGEKAGEIFLEAIEEEGGGQAGVGCRGPSYVNHMQPGVWTEWGGVGGKQAGDRTRGPSRDSAGITRQALNCP